MVALRKSVTSERAWVEPASTVLRGCQNWLYRRRDWGGGRQVAWHVCKIDSRPCEFTSARRPPRPVLQGILRSLMSAEGASFQGGLRKLPPGKCFGFLGFWVIQTGYCSILLWLISLKWWKLVWISACIPYQMHFVGEGEWWVWD